jgi:orotidine-5'-phosphate decarboxylase
MRSNKKQTEKQPENKTKTDLILELATDCEDILDLIKYVWNDIYDMMYDKIDELTESEKDRFIADLKEKRINTIYKETGVDLILI